MTETQDIFNKIWQHFIVERWPAGREASVNACCYRTEAGHCCAVGLFIPEEEFFSGMNGMGNVQRLLEQLKSNPRTASEDTLALLDRNLGFFCALQVHHDSAAVCAEMFHQLFEESLRELAERWELDVPEVT